MPNGIVKSEQDEYANSKLRGIRDHLDRLSKANAKTYPNKDSLIKVLKMELIAVGNFIRAESRDQPSLENRLWECVTTRYWPNKKANVNQIKGMYNNLVNKESGKPPVPRANGQSNGEAQKV